MGDAQFGFHEAALDDEQEYRVECIRPRGSVTSTRASSKDVKVSEKEWEEEKPHEYVVVDVKEHVQFVDVQGKMYISPVDDAGAGMGITESDQGDDSLNSDEEVDEEDKDQINVDGQAEAGERAQEDPQARAIDASTSPASFPVF